MSLETTGPGHGCHRLSVSIIFRCRARQLGLLPPPPLRCVNRPKEEGEAANTPASALCPVQEWSLTCFIQRAC
ncbi:surfactant associated 3 [Phyllostomus discolor]|uniref:Surfactant associated 3 n=1 Tax=Phyllostomus discolor TaxID=89673 RepID=A0A834EX67_9CHIR|nr:surfactant associated 3 [Phyllostomus discolor]